MRISIFAPCLIADPPACKTDWYRLPHTMLYEILLAWMPWILCRILSLGHTIIILFNLLTLS